MSSTHVVGLGVVLSVGGLNVFSGGLVLGLLVVVVVVVVVVEAMVLFLLMALRIPKSSGQLLSQYPQLPLPPPTCLGRNESICMEMSDAKRRFSSCTSKLLSVDRVNSGGAPQLPVWVGQRCTAIELPTAKAVKGCSAPQRRPF